MTGLNELYSGISKQENAYPKDEARDINAGKIKSIFLNFYQYVKCASRGKKLWTTFTPHIEAHTKLSLALHLANLTITLSS